MKKKIRRYNNYWTPTQMQIQVQMQIVNILKIIQHWMPYRQHFQIWKIVLGKKIVKILFRVFQEVSGPVKFKANFWILKLLLLGTKMEYLTEAKLTTYSTLFISMHQRLCLPLIILVLTIWMNMSKIKMICFLLPNLKMASLLEGSVKMDSRHPVKIYQKIFASFLVFILTALSTNYSSSAKG